MPALTPAAAAVRARVGLLTGCVQSAVFPDVNAATARVLAADGFEVVAPPQGCCGALSVHAGRLDEGKAFARRLIEQFDDVDLVVVNTSGCGSHLKDSAGCSATSGRRCSPRRCATSVSSSARRHRGLLGTRCR